MSGSKVHFRILIVMPLSAMALAGSGPSLLQIYIDLVCKSQYPEEEQMRGLTFLSNFSPTFAEGRVIHPFTVDAANCAKDPKVQQTVSILTGGTCPSPPVLHPTDGNSQLSLDEHSRYSQHPDRSFMGVCTCQF